MILTENVENPTKRKTETVVFNPPQIVCPFDGAPVWIGQHRPRTIHGLDQTIEATFRDAKCSDPDCCMPHLRYRPVEESLLALPGSSFGNDVLLAIGGMRLRDDFSFPRIHKHLCEQGVPIAPMTVQYQFRNYLALISCKVGLEDGKLRDRLRKQGAIIPVIDGVQFGEGDPVLLVPSEVFVEVAGVAAVELVRRPVVNVTPWAGAIIALVPRPE